MEEKNHLQSLIVELRRGSLTLAVLGSLKRPQYGYELLQTMQEYGISIEANTLYPLLRRLEGHQLLTSDWDTTESRPRKYYRVSSEGAEVYKVLLEEWNQMQNSMNRICGEDD